MDFGAASVALVTGLVVKLAVMAIAGWLVHRLSATATARPSRRLWMFLPKSDLAEVRLLFWALVLFAVSELTCGVEVYVLLRAHVATITVHAVSSVAAMSLFMLGLIRYTDRVLIRFGERGCLFNRLCDGCTIHQDAGCRLRPLLALGAAFLVLAGFAALLAPTASLAADTGRLVFPFPAAGAWLDSAVVPRLRAVSAASIRNGEAFRIPEWQFVLEYRLLAALGIACGATAVTAIARRREAFGIRAAAIASGVLGYVYFELVCYRVTGDALLGSLVHEVGELWFLVFTTELLVRAFGVRQASALAARAA
jgi:hypothetical protein